MVCCNLDFFFFLRIRSYGFALSCGFSGYFVDRCQQASQTFLRAMTKPSSSTIDHRRSTCNLRVLADGRLVCGRQVCADALDCNKMQSGFETETDVAAPQKCFVSERKVSKLDGYRNETKCILRPTLWSLSLTLSKRRPPCRVCNPCVSLFLCLRCATDFGWCNWVTRPEEKSHQHKQSSFQHKKPPPLCVAREHVVLEQGCHHGGFIWQWYTSDGQRDKVRECSSSVETLRQIEVGISSAMIFKVVSGQLLPYLTRILPSSVDLDHTLKNDNFCLRFGKS